MNKRLILSAAGAAVLLVAGCASDNGYYAAGVGYDYFGPGDVWYDGYYGPYTDGYWGDGGVFFYSDGRGGWRRDEGGHFRNHSFDGGQHFRAGARPAGDGHRR